MTELVRVAALTGYFQTMETLERYRGHFYNWYDTESLKPLLPLYVSTVDSGNLSGHLLTLRSGLLELPDRPVVNAQCFEGIRQTVSVLLEAAETRDGHYLTQVRTAVEAGPTPTVVSVPVTV